MSIKSEDLPDDPLETGSLPAMRMFEIEFRSLIVTNHELSIEGINRAEKEMVESTLDPDEASYERTYFTDLRTAANNLAIVAVVTRLDHWVASLCKRLKLREDKPKKTESRIIKRMEVLNEKLGDGPLVLSIFEALVTARDSVIHGDSRTNWEFNSETRWVDEKYWNGENLVVSEEQVRDAVGDTIKQLTWYHDEAHKHP